MQYSNSYLKAPCVRFHLLYNFAKWMYTCNRISRFFIKKYIDRCEGGMYYSLTLRKIFREIYDIDVGLGSYGGCFQGGWRPHVKIGRYCSIATGTQRLYANHPMDIVSTHPLFHLKEFGCVHDNQNQLYDLTIGNDVWIGVNAIITSKCRMIGDGAVIGAGAVVTKNCEPFGIYAGNPAKLIRYRFDEVTRNRIVESKWYELNPDQLKSLIQSFKTIDDFCEAARRINNSSSE